MGIKHYDKSLKERAVKLSEQRGNISEIARELGISGSQLTKWRKDLAIYGENSFPGKGNERLTAAEREIRELKKALKNLTIDEFWDQKTNKLLIASNRLLTYCAELG